MKEEDKDKKEIKPKKPSVDNIYLFVIVLFIWMIICLVQTIVEDV